jgi:hypothetical protein
VVLGFQYRTDVNQLSFSGQTVSDPFESFLRPVESFCRSVEWLYDPFWRIFERDIAKGFANAK